MSEKKENKEKENANATEKQVLPFLKKSSWPLFVFLLATFLSWTAWGLILNEVSPFSSPQFAISFFYITFFFSVFTTLTLLGTLTRMTFQPFVSIGSAVNNSLRQGIILAVVATVALVFQDFRVLNWWDAGLLLIMGVLVEISFSESKT